MPMDKIELNEIAANERKAEERFHFANEALNFKLGEFWSWNQSNLLENRTRGILAEFIVMKALGVEQKIRTEWDSYDIRTKDGIKIEVKSAAYIQSWKQKKLSTIQFNLKPTRALENGTYSNELKRQADYYIFCLLHHQDQLTIDPMNLEQWSFNVMKAVTLNNELQNQASIGLSKIKSLEHRKCNYSELADLKLSN